MHVECTLNKIFLEHPKDGWMRVHECYHWSYSILLDHFSEEVVESIRDDGAVSLSEVYMCTGA